MTNNEQPPNNNNGNGNASGLIADFPNDQPEAVRSVRFSNTCEVVVIERPSQRDNRNKSYNQDDYEHFKRVRAYDVVFCSNLYMYKKSVGEELTLEDVCNFTGLESYMSPDVPGRARAILQAREQHSNRVLNVSNQYPHEVVARFSERSSRTHRVQAQRVAASSFGATNVWGISTSNAVSNQFHLE